MNDTDREYIPLHEKLPDEPSEYVPRHEKLPESAQESHESEVQKPVYDDFMYEPIGFEELDDKKPEAFDFPSAEKEKKRSSGTAAAITLFAVLLIASAAASVYGIYNDIAHSSKAVQEIVNSRRAVIYLNSKPENAKAAEYDTDEYGRYSSEAVASMVKPSIVEIFAYGDAMRSQLIGTGSGVVLSKDGYIVTNAHVLQEGGFHSVSTDDGDVFDAKVIGRDVKTDIAVLKVDGQTFVPAVFGNSDEATVGERVMAIGNPAGLSGTVTDGIISAVERKIKGDSTGFEMTCIQTNAQISPGNSGGALVNMYGQVIGITSSKYVSSSLEGLGFAITINEAQPIIDELISKGYISGRFRIGIMLIDMSSPDRIAAIEEELGFPLPDDFAGIYISEIQDDSDIKNTELKPGDFITAVKGKSVSTYSDFYDTISSNYAAGDYVEATAAHVDKNGKVNYYNIRFKLMEDTSGKY